MTNNGLARTKSESTTNRKAYLERAIKYGEQHDFEGEKYFRNLAELERLNYQHFLGTPPF